MPQYRETFNRAGILDFVVLRRCFNVCLLMGLHRSSLDIRYYEVHLLRMKKSRRESAAAGAMILCAPSESEWGKYGWTYLRLKDAEAKFHELADREREKAIVRSGVRL